MKLAIAALGALLVAAASAPHGQTSARKGVALSELAWPDAEPWLTASAVVVIPLGAGAIEQGAHLKLDSDARLAGYLAGRVTAASAVVVAPPLNYHFFPAYEDYPGSTSLSATTARDLTVDVVRSLARAGPRRFYVLNTAPSALGPLSAAAKVLSESGILLGYTDPDYWEKQPAVLKQPPIATAHADEAATSMMLFIDPSVVDLGKATREYPGRRARSASGTFGDATLASAQKGEALVNALVAGMLADIETVRSAPLPDGRAMPAPPSAARPAVRSEERMPTGCTANEDRAIRAVAERFSYLWTQQDAGRLSELFTRNGDIRHPDGSIERGQEVILANRAQLFAQKDYENSRYTVQLNDIRCVPGTNAAIADGKWELRLQRTPQSKPGRGAPAVPYDSGWCTLVLLKSDANSWSIEAWRYTVSPPPGADQPVLLAKPGYTGRGGG
ncbi:MAG TPA: creatininase family protein [Vicinamibacterales bacterium]|jgi:creatinine amidohydrolase